MNFAVVTVLHDSRDDLARLLDSLALLDERPRVIAVDSGSRDDGAELARSWGAEVVALDGNPGFGAANNAGVERVTEPVTVLLNPDVELLDSGLARLAALAAERDVLLAPRLLNDDGTVQRSAHPPPGRVEALVPALLPEAVLPARFNPSRSDAPRRVGWAIAAALAARTEVLRRLGPFEARDFLLFEDMDLCLRAAEAGVPTELRPEIALRHRGGHAVNRSGEPFELHARRRREVVERRLGRRALALDDLAQGLTFATRTLAHRDSRRERAQLAALRAARRG
jgi:GT2 family glycosyltransferase